MATLAKKKAAYLKQLEQDIAAIPASQTVPSGQFVTAGYLAMELARYTLKTADTKSFEAFANTAKDNLAETIACLSDIYGNQYAPEITTAHYQDQSFFGQKYRCSISPGNVTIYFDISRPFFEPTLAGPGGEIPETTNLEDGYRLTGDVDCLRQDTPESRAYAYYIHRLASGMAREAGEEISLAITNHNDTIRYQTVSPVIYAAHEPAYIKLDRRKIDQMVDAEIAIYRASLQKQCAGADELDSIRTSWQALLNAKMGEIDAPTIINASYEKDPDGYFKYLLAVEFDTITGTSVDIQYVKGVDIREVADALTDHRRFVESKKLFKAAGGYQINGVFAAFLHSRYGDDYQKIIDEVLVARHHTMDLADPLANDKSVRFNVQLRSNELRGKFSLAPHIKWDYTKMVFSKGAIPLAMRAGLIGQPLSKLVDISAIPGLASAVITEVFDRDEGFSLAIDYDLTEVTKAMASLSATSDLRQAA